MKTYRVEHDGEWIVVRFPFSRDVIDRIKTIPSHLREWMPDEKAWRFKGGAWEDEEEFLFPEEEWKREERQRGLFDEDDPFADPPSAPPRPIYQVVTHHTVLHLLPSAPPEVIKAAYQALIRKHHPDVGGNEETAKKINAAWLALKGS